MPKTQTPKAPITRLALLFGPSMSFFGTGPDKATALRNCLREVKGAASVLGRLKKDATVRVNVFDYAPYDKITWEDFIVTGHKPDGSSEPIRPLEIVTADRDGVEISTEAPTAA